MLPYCRPNLVTTPKANKQNRKIEVSIDGSLTKHPNTIPSYFLLVIIYQVKRVGILETPTHKIFPTCKLINNNIMQNKIKTCLIYFIIAKRPRNKTTAFKQAQDRPRNLPWVYFSLDNIFGLT